MRRHGTWHRDLNAELLMPFSRHISASWAHIFETDLFASFDSATVVVIDNILKEFEESVPPGLKDRARTQVKTCLKDVKLTMRNTIVVVHQSLVSEQKRISRCVTPHVQAQLAEGYDQATKVRGKGSAVRQKARQIY